jgi:undecaprenyl-diphosphatase
MLVLGLVQGLCEFLPVSSSGHLALAQALFGLHEPEIVLDLVLHLGTLFAVIFFYRHSLLALISELRYIPKAMTSAENFSLVYRTREDFHLGILIIAGSIPTAIIGLFFQDLFSSLFTSVPSIAVALFITGFVLLATNLQKTDSPKGTLSMTLSQALIIGFVQGLAIAPGLSRSGLTIGAALLLGLNRELSARYSFLLSIPAIIGGLAISLIQGEASSFELKFLLLGFALSAVTGYLALKLLTNLIDRGHFSIFSIWCFLVGGASLCWYFSQ